MDIEVKEWRESEDLQAAISEFSVNASNAEGALIIFNVPKNVECLQWIS